MNPTPTTAVVGALSIIMACTLASGCGHDEADVDSERAATVSTAVSAPFNVRVLGLFAFTKGEGKSFWALAPKTSAQPPCYDHFAVQGELAPPPHLPKLAVKHVEMRRLSSPSHDWRQIWGWETFDLQENVEVKSVSQFSGKPKSDWSLLSDRGDFFMARHDLADSYDPDLHFLHPELPDGLSNRLGARIRFESPHAIVSDTYSRGEEDPMIYVTQTYSNGSQGCPGQSPKDCIGRRYAEETVVRFGSANLLVETSMDNGRRYKIRVPNYPRRESGGCRPSLDT